MTTRPPRRMLRRALGVLLLVSALAGCGGGRDALPVLSDDSTCEEAVELVDEAIRRAQSYLARQADDALERDDIIFALSAAEERRECFDDEQTVQRATGLRLTLFSDAS